jgi:hypothetical protein
LKDKNILIDPSKYIKNSDKDKFIASLMQARNQRKSVDALHFGTNSNSQVNT